MRAWLLLGGAIAAEVAGTMALRASIDHQAWIALVVAGYVTAFALLALVLREKLPIGVAYGIWGASGVALTALLGAVIFDELLSPLAVAGIVLIIVGVVLVETGSRRPEDVTT
ncbi:QacE family quaternary ammonium compound efflux SMR transporter [Aeromicrobium phragmitis]|uniref:QacE family quaternary ammonium compound efflux SMR transporter n=1 Tax=Aeromicrobium phragmitis TaxID=2478914 RepID=A0A3L8PMC5_9ACTN|nr:SMR family transporter [Aeromicrobium phragmitis]RLV55688.1 QacE family quaternary ammonium compound efflux SMR transporter [Aeromicrobium phragmitis]